MTALGFVAELGAGWGAIAVVTAVALAWLAP